MTRIGICAPQVGDEVELPRSHQRVETAGAEGTDLRLQRGHPPRGEDPREQAPVDGVDGGILEDQHAGRHLDVGPDEFDDSAAPGNEGLRIEQGTLDVREPASA